MSSLIAIEDALLARAEVAIGTAARAYRPLPGGLSQLAALLAATLLVPGLQPSPSAYYADMFREFGVLPPSP